MKPDAAFWDTLAASDCVVSQVVFYRVLDRRFSRLVTPEPGGKTEWALVRVLRGGYRYETEDGGFDCFPGDVLFLPLHSVYSHITLELPVSAHVIYFQLSLPDGTPFPSDRRVQRLIPRDPAAIRACFEETERCFFSAAPSALPLKAAMYRLLDAVRREVSARGEEDGPHARIAPAQELMRTHKPGELTVSALAASCGLSEYAFREYFKQVMGTTPKRYLEERMVERAELLLASSDLTVTDAALAAGFSDPSYFFKMYRRLRGHTPGTVAKYRSSDGGG